MKITWKGKVSYSHLIGNPESKCFALHGHTAEVLVEIDGEQDENGMVVDYNKIKAVVEEMDHRFIVNEGSVNNRSKDQDWKVYPISGEDGFPMLDVFITLSKKYVEMSKEPFVIKGEVTAENLSRRVSEMLDMLLCTYNINEISVTWKESENTSATSTLWGEKHGNKEKG